MRTHITRKTWVHIYKLHIWVQLTYPSANYTSKQYVWDPQMLASITNSCFNCVFTWQTSAEVYFKTVLRSCNGPFLLPINSNTFYLPLWQTTIFQVSKINKWQWLSWPGGWGEAAETQGLRALTCRVWWAGDSLTKVSALSSKFKAQ